VDEQQIRAAPGPHDGCRAAGHGDHAFIAHG
jgi:hypothetical protein